VRVAGRLNGAEIARKEWYLQGRLPLQTLRADIDYGTAGGAHHVRRDCVKCWVYQGEKIPQRGGKPGQPRKFRSLRKQVQYMLIQKKVKYLQQQRGRRTGKALARRPRSRSAIRD